MRSNRNAVQRLNEYFVPKDGIDREVITADVCRYLGNDALVRPGRYEDPQTGRVTDGYLIKAYRNLTSEMIADLKADSARWEAERRETASRAQPGVDYRASTTHQSRQYYGPSDSNESPYTQQAEVAYEPTQAAYAQGNYQAPSAASYASNYGGTPAVAAAPFYQGANRTTNAPGASSRNAAGYADQNQYTTDARVAGQQYYPPHLQQTTQQQYPSPDAFYNRGPAYDTMDYEQNYAAQQAVQPNPTQGRRREREDREPDREHRRRR